MLISQLPDDSRTKAALRGGDEYLGWTQDRYVLVAIFNVLQQLLYVQTASKTKSSVPKPKPIEVPGSKKAQSSNNEFETMLARAKARREQKQGV